MLKTNKGYQSKYRDLLTTFSKAAAKDKGCRSKTYSLFFPQVGKRFTKTKIKILFCGRATNGWGEKEQHFKPKQIIGREIEILKESIDWSQADNRGECPMQWVIKKWKGDVGRKPFWRIIKNLTLELNKGNNLSEKNFTEAIAWTQYYKIAPARGGNPKRKAETKPQDEIIVYDLLEKEIEILKPDYVVFMIGNNWRMSCFNYKVDDYVMTAIQGKFLTYELKIKKLPAIGLLCDRPEGKNEEKFVDELVKYIKGKK